MGWKDAAKAAAVTANVVAHAATGHGPSTAQQFSQAQAQQQATRAAQQETATRAQNSQPPGEHRGK